MKKLELKNCEHGKGVFSKENIKFGDAILQFKGPVVSINDLPKPYTAENDYYLQIGKNIFMGPSGEIDDYVNHSCEPNTTAKNYCDIAIRNIKKDEEITGDYSEDLLPGEEMQCNCGSERCRKIVKNSSKLLEKREPGVQ